MLRNRDVNIYTICSCFMGTRQNGCYDIKYLKYQEKSYILDQAFSFSSVTGQIRTVIGQAQLLIDQRFRQFSGLIDLSEVSLLVYTPSFALVSEQGSSTL